MKIIKHGRNIHEFKFVKEHLFLLLSDLHWDNPKCDRKLLKSHLDEAVRRDAKVILNGDTFCLMQGRYDGRSMKGDIRPEHNTNTYADTIIKDAVKWFAPYKDNIAVIGYGNHETSVLRRAETDVLQRFVDLFNYTHDTSVQVGGYGGTLIFSASREGSNTASSFKIKYFHGSGGGGVVTKGVIQNNRIATFAHGVDAVWQGHVHELYHHTDMVEVVQHSSRHGYSTTLKPYHHLRTSTYKEEYVDQFGGWHVERGAPPKPLGGYWMQLNLVREYSDGSEVSFLKPTFTQCT